MSKRLVFLLAAWIFLTPALPAQHELAPSISHSSWTTADGLPQNSVAGISQDAAGYLWVATFGGLARFDGRHFEVFDLVSRPDLPANRFSRVLVAGDGTIWVWAQEIGLFRYRDDRFTHFETPGFLRRFAEDSRGRIWGTFERGLGLIDEDGVELVRQGGYQTALPASDGTLWVSATGGTLTRFENGSESVLGPADGLSSSPLLTMLEDADGVLWGGNLEGVWRSTDSTRSEFERVDVAPPEVQVMARDGRGALWFGCRSLLWRWDLDAPTPTVVAAGNFDNFFRDARGNLWAGTLGDGLHCLRYSPLHDAATSLGLPHQNSWSITGDASGTAYVLFGRSLAKIREGEVIRREFQDNIRTLLVDRTGALWLGAFSGVIRVRDGVDTAFREESGLSGKVRALMEDRAGSLWVGTQDALFRRSGDRTERVGPEDLVGIRSMLEDTTRDGLWVGTDSGLFRLEGDSVNRFTAETGFAPGAVRTLHQDAEGVLWAGTYGGGLCRLENDEVTRYSRENGLADNFLSCIIEDDDQRFWINSNSGPFVVHLADLNRVARGTTDRVACTAFTAGEGAREANGGSQPAGWRAPDGRMWFPTISGVTVADPRELSLDEEPPNVLIESLEVDDDRKLDVRYAALGFSSPERVRVQYRLDGHDREWIESNGQRAANYSYLRPGDYEFRLRARNGYGPWSPEVAERFEVDSRFHESKLFLMAILLLVGAGAFALAERRVKVARARTAELVRLVHERERAERSLSRSQAALRRLSRELLSNQETERRHISRELHDDVTQRLAALAIQTELLEDRLDATSTRTRDQLRDVVQKAQQLAGDVQQLSRRLHPIGLRTLGLCEAARQECEAFTRRTEVAVELDEAVASDEVAEEVAVGAFRILQESLHNIEKHAASDAVRVSLSMEKDELVLSIIDSGRGFDPDDDADVGLGLVTMQERAAAIGGELSILSKPGKGTTVRLRAPGRSNRA